MRHTRYFRSQFNVLSAIKLACFCWVLLFGSSVHGESLEGIDVTIDAAQTKFTTQDQILIEVSYHNVTDQPVQILKWGTALEGRINEDFLSIFFDGNELPFVGRHYKRAAPTVSDYITILPGDKLTSVVDVLTGYNLDYKGVYELGMRSSVIAQPLLRKQSISLSLTGDRPISFKVAPIVESCVAGRRAEIDSALSAAESIAAQARDALSGAPSDLRASAARYTEWFGVYSQARWNSVQDHFNRISSAASGRTLTFICDDSESAFAYVFPSRPYDIYLGRAFWNAPRTGTDSRAGTIIHELSHFNVLGGTDDLAYGQSAARGLADGNPSGAVRNADSHEYFAENTPFLPMPSAAPAPAPTSEPDLLITSVVVLDQSPDAGDVVRVQATVENAGGLLSASTLLRIMVSSDAQISNNDSQLAQLSVPAMAGASTQFFQANVSAPRKAGQFWIGACVQASAGEVATDNNCSIGVQVDVVSSIVLVPILELLMEGGLVDP